MKGRTDTVLILKNIYEKTCVTATVFKDMINKSFHSGELTLCPSWHELPKSTILIADLLGLHKRIFSGLRSQWIMLSSGVDRNSKAVHSCCANLRVKLRDTPRKLVLRSKSYKLYDSNSKTRHRWLRHMKCRFSFTTTQSHNVIHYSQEVIYKCFFTLLSFLSSTWYVSKKTVPLLTFTL